MRIYNKKRLKRFTRKKTKIQHKSLKRKRINKKILKGSATPSEMKEYIECVEDIVVCGITSLDQYIISPDKMFSVFSETHRSYYFDEGILSIEQFIIESWQKTGNCYILLEYDPELSLNEVDLNSQNIQNIKKLASTEKYKDKVNVMGIDIRRRFINNDILYTDEWKKYNFQTIKQKFIDPFLAVGESPITHLSYSNYDKHWYEYLEIIKKDFLKLAIYDYYIIYFQEIRDTYNKLLDENVKKVFKDCVSILRNQWKKCMDYYILTIVMKRDKNQYALLVGSQHGDNLYEMLSSYNIKYTTRGPIPRE